MGPRGLSVAGDRIGPVGRFAARRSGDRDGDGEQHDRNDRLPAHARALRQRRDLHQQRRPHHRHRGCVRRQAVGRRRRRDHRRVRRRAAGRRTAGRGKAGRAASVDLGRRGRERVRPDLGALDHRGGSGFAGLLRHDQRGHQPRQRCVLPRAARARVAAARRRRDLLLPDRQHRSGGQQQHRRQRRAVLPLRRTQAGERPAGLLARDALRSGRVARRHAVSGDRDLDRAARRARPGLRGLGHRGRRQGPGRRGAAGFPVGSLASRGARRAGSGPHDGDHELSTRRRRVVRQLRRPAHAAEGEGRDQLHLRRVACRELPGRPGSQLDQGRSRRSRGRRHRVGPRFRGVPERVRDRPARTRLDHGRGPSLRGIRCGTGVPARARPRRRITLHQDRPRCQGPRRVQRLRAGGRPG